jgi:Cu(I)/Ag(I) efflux system membrane fusion protein
MLNMETKTAKVRVEVRNTASLEFKPEMFATVQIASPVSVSAVAVPDQAIIRSGERNIAVIALGGGYFDPREVELGVTADGYDQILSGIKEGEKIVVSSQFLIDSESNLKAAISQMAGHGGMPPDSTGGMEMSKPMGQAAPAPEEQAPRSAAPPGAGKATKMEKTPEATAPAADLIDPVCGMETGGEENLSYSYKGKKYYFCSHEDMEKFKSNPGNYLK